MNNHWGRHNKVLIIVVVLTTTTSQNCSGYNRTKEEVKKAELQITNEIGN
ncbi:hypothetical protein KFK09_025875 [Dendrobium nobile]|uniref:Uncharacterized protein n=1 Tax=Dendrobium nobile TaxID=94219 RepID=A0A8T3AB92_DENNO|nr:hypothetical protein KFK09_025875 [Dendrobium nobile]